KGNIDNHFRDCICDQSYGVYDTFQFVVQSASGCCKSRSIGNQQSQKSCTESYKKGILIYSEKALIIEHRLYMFQGKADLVWPFLNQRHHKDYCKDCQDTQDDKC